MKILVLGDTHGDLNSVKYALQIAVERGCEVVIQVGDFGFGWDLHRDPGEQFPQRVNALAKNSRISFLWLDGNHENFDALEEIVDTTSPNPQQMGSNLHYLPRGCTFEIAGVTFLALGGAYSIDKDHRVHGVSWWPQETITYRDVDRALAAIDSNGRPDVMVTHDVPEGVFPYELFLHGKHGHESRNNREAVRAVYEAARPKLLLHGHMHVRYDLGDVIGLDCNGSGKASWYVLDTEDWV